MDARESVGQINAPSSVFMRSATAAGGRSTARSRGGRVRSGLSSRSYGATCSEAMRRARSHCSNSFSGYETLHRARFSIASPDARHSARQKRSVASCPASIFHFQSFGLGRALCGAPSFGIQGRPRPAEFSVRVHGCSHPFIGHPLDTSKVFRAKYLISLALPRGLEPLFSP